MQGFRRGRAGGGIGQAGGECLCLLRERPRGRNSGDGTEEGDGGFLYGGQVPFPQ